MTYQTDNPEIDKLYTENRKLQEENKQLREDLRLCNLELDEEIAHNKQQKADFIKKLKKFEYYAEHLIETREDKLLIRDKMKDILKTLKEDG